MFPIVGKCVFHANYNNAHNKSIHLTLNNSLPYYIQNINFMNYKFSVVGFAILDPFNIRTCFRILFKSLFIRFNVFKCKILRCNKL